MKIFLWFHCILTMAITRDTGLWGAIHALPVDSNATNVDEIIHELKSGKFVNVAERAGRAQDKDDCGGLETLRKKVICRMKTSMEKSGFNNLENISETNVRQRMNIVIIGHVDNGKSTIVGRLLADTNSLPEGKIDQIKSLCERNSKPFEYAFLIDALKDERAQGITIDSARVFFKTKNRDYIIIDAPGHIEFLKNTWLQVLLVLKPLCL